MKIVQHTIVWSMALVLVVAIFTHTQPATGAENKIENKVSEIQYGTSTPQFVLLSFDGSKNLEMWKETREFAQKMNNEGKPLHFTYFINSIYFLTEKNRDIYESPRSPRGESMIGFGDNEENVALRAKEVKKAYEEGNEIASHSAGHFLGKSWNEEEWTKEFTSFEDLILNIQKNNPDVEIPDLSFLKNEIAGFRAPDLGVGEDLYKTLKKFNFSYDASGVGLPDTFPIKDENGIWHIPLNTIEIGEERGYTISMDYSLWMYQSHGVNEALKGTPLWNKYFNDVKKAYLEYFDRNYQNKRAPVSIGHHFSLWNDGVYWEAMKSFAEEVCGRKDVYCVTFKEYVKYLNLKNSEPLVKKQ